MLTELCESAVSQVNLLADLCVQAVTMHTFVYSSHIEDDKNNDITSPKVNTAASWSHRGSLEHNLEPADGQISLFGVSYCYSLILEHIHNADLSINVS